MIKWYKLIFRSMIYIVSGFALDIIFAYIALPAFVDFNYLILSLIIYLVSVGLLCFDSIENDMRYSKVSHILQILMNTIVTAILILFIFSRY